MTSLELTIGTRYRRIADGETMTLVARFPIMLRSARGPWVTTFGRLATEFEELPPEAGLPADEESLTGASRSIDVSQFMLLSAARLSLANDTEDTSIPTQILAVVPLINAQERDLLARDIGTDLNRKAGPDVVTAWERLRSALALAAGEPDNAKTVPATAIIISTAVRYALGRHTYMPQMVAEEVARVAPSVSDPEREELAAVIESHQSGSSDDTEDGAYWRAAVHALRAARDITDPNRNETP
jgi:hypothetical protein